MGNQRILRSFVVLAALMLALTVLPAAPAMAACNSSICDGDSATGCISSGFISGSIDVRNSSGTVIGRVELWASARCAAWWTKVRSFIGPQSLHAEIERWSSGTLQRRYTVDATGTSVVTPVVVDGPAIHGAGRVAGSVLYGYWHA